MQGGNNRDICVLCKKFLEMKVKIHKNVELLDYFINQL